MTMDWKGLLRKLFGAVTQPNQYFKPPCPICGQPLQSFPGSSVLMCVNGHRFDPTQPLRPDSVMEVNKGDTHGEI